MKALLDRVVQKWQNEQVAFRTGVPRAAIELFERENGIWLPSDFIEYLLRTGGMAPDTSDRNQFSFLPFEAMTCWSPYLTFAHWAIESSIFVIALSTASREPTAVVRIDNGQSSVASSFEVLMDLYLNEPAKLLSQP
jgi:hypothetical protein